MIMDSVLIIFFILWNLRDGMCNRCNVGDITVQTNFNISKFLGRWYEIKWLPQFYIPPEQLYQDYQHTYTKSDNGNITIKIWGRDPVELGVCFQYSAELFTTAIPGKLLYKRKKTLTEYMISDYWIIKTDYYNYAIVYGCRVKNITSSTCVEADSWIWSRSQSISQQNLTVVEKEIENLCLNGTAFANTKQTQDCSVTSGCQLHGKMSTYLILFVIFFSIFQG